MGQPASDASSDRPSDSDRGWAIPLTKRRVGRALVAALLFVLYAFGQPWHLRGDIADVQATTLPAWHLVETGNWDLSEYRGLNPWLVDVPGGTWTNRAPGAIGVAMIGYATTSPFTDGFQNWPGVLTAIMTAWLAVLVIAALSDRLRPGTWLLAVVVFGMGTATWGVSAEQLWPHGPAQLAVAGSLWLSVTRRPIWSGVAMALGVLIRPPIVVIGIGMALVQSFLQRSIKPALTLGLPSAMAAGAYLGYSRILFGSWSPTAAYEAVGGFVADFGITDRARNIAESFVGLSHGILIWSPWIAVALFGVSRIRHLVPEWLYYTPLVAAIYIMLHSLFEIASGALFFNYRYQLEAVTLAAPLLIAATPEFDDTQRRRLLMGVAIAISVALQLLFLFVSKCYLDETGAFTCALIP